MKELVAAARPIHRCGGAAILQLDLPRRTVTTACWRDTPGAADDEVALVRPADSRGSLLLAEREQFACGGHRYLTERPAGMGPGMSRTVANTASVRRPHLRTSE